MKRAVDFFKRNSYIYITAFVIFIIGVCIGALGAAGIDDDEKKQLSEYTMQFFGSEAPIEHFDVLKKCALRNFKLVALSGICAISVFSMPFCFAVVGFKGFVSGFSVGIILKLFGGKGAVFVFSSFVPTLAFSLPVMFGMCAFCVRYAFMCYKNKTRRKKEALPFAAAMLAIWVVMCFFDLTDSFISEFVVNGIF